MDIFNLRRVIIITVFPRQFLAVTQSFFITLNIKLFCSKNQYKNYSSISFTKLWLYNYYLPFMAWSFFSLCAVIIFANLFFKNILSTILSSLGEQEIESNIILRWHSIITLSQNFEDLEAPPPLFELAEFC